MMLKKLFIFLFIITINLFNPALSEEILKINTINFDNSDNIIFLGATTKVMYINVKSMKLTNPDRISFDIDNAVWTKSAESWTLKNSLIKNVKISQYSTNPHVVRVVLTYDKGFNVNKLKLYRVDNNLIFSYNNKKYPQTNFHSVFSDDKAKVNYYEYALISQDIKLPAQASTDSNLVKAPEVIEIQNAFNSKGELVKPNQAAVQTSKAVDQTLKTRFYISSVDVKRGNALIRGIGSVAVESPFIVQDPTKLVFDMPNTIVSPTIKNKEFVLGENETILISQYEPTKARVVVTSNDAEKLRPIYSYD